MKPAPAHILQLFFRWVRVEIDEEHLPPEPINPLVAAHWLEGVKISSECGTFLVDETHEHGTLYMTSLRVRIENERTVEDAEQKFSPYKIDVEARATVLVIKGAELLGNVEDIAAVNGTSMVWSAIREQVATITSRMPAGPLVLPSMNFRDVAPSAQRSRKASKPTETEQMPTTEKGSGKGRRKKS